MSSQDESPLRTPLVGMDVNEKVGDGSKYPKWLGKSPRQRLASTPLSTSSMGGLTALNGATRHSSLSKLSPASNSSRPTTPTSAMRSFSQSASHLGDSVTQKLPTLAPWRLLSSARHSSNPSSKTSSTPSSGHKNSFSRRFTPPFSSAVKSPTVEARHASLTKTPKRAQTPREDARPQHGTPAATNAVQITVSEASPMPDTVVRVANDKTDDGLDDLESHLDDLNLETFRDVQESANPIAESSLQDAFDALKIEEPKASGVEKRANALEKDSGASKESKEPPLRRRLDSIRSSGPFSFTRSFNRSGKPPIGRSKTTGPMTKHTDRFLPNRNSVDLDQTKSLYVLDPVNDRPKVFSKPAQNSPQLGTFGDDDSDEDADLLAQRCMAFSHQEHDESVDLLTSTFSKSMNLAYSPLSESTLSPKKAAERLRDQRALTDSLGLDRNARILKFGSSTSLDKYKTRLLPGERDSIDSLRSVHSIHSRRSLPPHQLSSVGNFLKESAFVKGKSYYRNLHHSSSNASLLSTRSSTSSLSIQPQVLPDKENENTVESFRSVPRAAERVLDAPGLLNDFYLNLVDWSTQNTVAIALGESVYFWDSITGAVSQLCDVTECTPARHSASKGSVVCSVKFSPDGDLVALGLSNGMIQIYDALEHRLKRVLRTAADERVPSLSWSGSTVSSGTQSGIIFNTDLRSPENSVSVYKSHTQQVCGLSWRSYLHNNQEFLASGGNDNVVNVWDSRHARKPWMHKSSHKAAVKALAWCPWQPSMLASGGGSADKTIHLWNTTRSSRLSSIATSSQVSSLHFNPNAKELYSTHGDPTCQIGIWGCPNLALVNEIPMAHDARILTSAMSPDGSYLATISKEENLKFWKIYDAGKGSRSLREDLDESLCLR